MMSQGGGAGAPVAVAVAAAAAAEADGEGRSWSWATTLIHLDISRISRGHEARAETAKNGNLTRAAADQHHTRLRQTKAGTAGTFNQPHIHHPSSSASRGPATIHQLTAVITSHTTTQALCKTTRRARSAAPGTLRTLIAHHQC